MGCGKQQEANCIYSIPSKTAAWFLSLRWKTCLWQNCSLGSCACSEWPALGHNTHDDSAVKEIVNQDPYIGEGGDSEVNNDESHGYFPQFPALIVHRCGAGGSMRACHAPGPGSIPGRDKFPGWGFFRFFSSPVRQMSGSFRRQGPRISFGHHNHALSFITGANDLRCWRALQP